jgi:hypothetical protein
MITEPEPSEFDKLIEDSLALKAESERLAEKAHQLDEHIKELEMIAKTAMANRKKSGIFES